MPTESHHAIVHLPPGVVKFVRLRTPVPGAGESVVRAELSAVSPGTELRKLRAGGGGGGGGGGGFVPGYSVVGVVVEGAGRGQRVLAPGGRVEGGAEGGEGVRGVGREWGAHQALHVVRTEELVPVPPHLSAREVALCRLASIAQRGWDASARVAGRRVVVVGLGIIGQLAARIWAAQGHTVTGVDRSARRVEALVGGGGEGIVAAGPLAAAFPGRRFDVVVDCTGVPAVVDDAVELLDVPGEWNEAWRASPVYVLQGSYAGNVQFDYDRAFRKQATFVLPRDRTSRDGAVVMDLVATGKLKLADLLTHEFAPADAAKAYADAGDPHGGVIGAAFRWSE